MPKVTMPQLGESVAEGTIGKWLKQVGDHVAKYEPIVEVITDKVNAEVPSPFEGTLTAILVQEGETVPNNAEIAVIEGAGEASGAGAASTAPAMAEAPGPAPASAAPSGNGKERTVLGLGAQGPAGSDERSVEEMRVAASAAPSAPAATAPADYEGRLTPAVRRLAREHEIDLALRPAPATPGASPARTCWPTSRRPNGWRSGGHGSRRGGAGRDRARARHTVRAGAGGARAVARRRR